MISACFFDVNFLARVNLTATRLPLSIVYAACTLLVTYADVPQVPVLTATDAHLLPGSPGHLQQRGSHVAVGGRYRAGKTESHLADLVLVVLQKPLGRSVQELD